MIEAFKVPATQGKEMIFGANKKLLVEKTSSEVAVRNGIIALKVLGTRAKSTSMEMNYLLNLGIVRALVKCPQKALVILIKYRMVIMKWVKKVARIRGFNIKIMK